MLYKTKFECDNSCDWNKFYKTRYQQGYGNCDHKKKWLKCTKEKAERLCNENPELKDTFKKKDSIDIPGKN